eukprot:gb/GEZN01001322.1/.p1 GENE.gb/GEZN01001322.1/~~gb/GEZN01001322.1/.p1  ORF type:complete len:998 (+),score=83.03 gb/GEZN01001322.1/:62-3055(+)
MTSPKKIETVSPPIAVTPPKFKVEGQLKLSRKKQEYEIEVDFKQMAIRLSKLSGNVKQFTLSSVVAMERLDGLSGSRLRLIIQSGEGSEYKKELRFKSADDRDSFCKLIHRGIENGVNAPLEDGNLSSQPLPTMASFLTTVSPTKGSSSSRRNKLASLTVAHNGLHPLMPGEQVHQFRSHTSRIDLPYFLPTAAFSKLTGNAARRQSMFVRAKTTSSLLPTISTSQGKQLTEHVHQISRGDLALTSFRIMYRDYEAMRSEHKRRKDTLSADIPLAMIKKVVQQKTKVRIFCKDYREVEFRFDADQQWVDDFMQTINNLAFSGDQSSTFAFSRTPQEAHALDGWQLYDAKREYARCELDSGYWRLFSNSGYKFSPTYPYTFCVPRALSDDEIRAAGKHRSRTRLPVMTWRHPITKAVIGRCAQPYRGFGRSCPEDEKLMTFIRLANPTDSEKLYVIDARPYAAAVGNSMQGKGFEKSTNELELEFMGIDNIHAVRNSLDKITSLCAQQINSQNVPDDWLTKVEQTKWPYYIRLILLSAVHVVSLLDGQGSSVLVHCSDGWDRTSQLTALATLMLDPYFRTLEGFAILIEKEWLSFGHQFAKRAGHMDPQMSTQRAPIFMQFIECVWQMAHQFASAFEFNEDFLIEIIDQSYACCFGTFLCDCEGQRKKLELDKRTTSLWSYLLSPGNRPKYTNPFFRRRPETLSRLLFDTHPSRIQFWHSYHMRWFKTLECPPTATATIRPETLEELLLQEALSGVDHVNALSLTENKHLAKARIPGTWPGKENPGKAIPLPARTRSLSRSKSQSSLRPQSLSPSSSSQLAPPLSSSVYPPRPPLPRREANPSPESVASSSRTTTAVNETVVVEQVVPDDEADQARENGAFPFGTPRRSGPFGTPRHSGQDSGQVLEHSPASDSRTLETEDPSREISEDESGQTTPVKGVLRRQWAELMSESKKSVTAVTAVVNSENCSLLSDATGQEIRTMRMRLEKKPSEVDPSVS